MASKTAYKKQKTDKVYVVHYASHVDCYKRGESSSTIVGVFREKVDAIHNALAEFADFINTLQDRNGDIKVENQLLQRFIDDLSADFTDEEELELFNLLCEMQQEQQGEFSLQASGNYVEISERTII